MYVSVYVFVIMLIFSTCIFYYNIYLISTKNSNKSIYYLVKMLNSFIFFWCCCCVMESAREWCSVFLHFFFYNIISNKQLHNTIQYWEKKDVFRSECCVGVKKTTS